jgi:hypothetical protein
LTQRRSPGAKEATSWKRLNLLPGAPDCVIEAAWRWLIAQHHPDRGGDVALATAINNAHDDVRGSGSAANEYVAANYNGEPWHVLGLVNTADAALAERAGRQLAAELQATHARLAARVEWAVANFSAAGARPGRERAPRAAPPPPSRVRRVPLERPAAPRAPATPGMPEGLPRRIDLGSVTWGSDAAQRVQLSWRHHQPYDVRVEAEAPVVARVTTSKAVPGRFMVELAVDWESDALNPESGRRGYTLDGFVTFRWGGGGETRVALRGIVLYPASVRVSAQTVRLETSNVGDPVWGTVALQATQLVDVEIETPAWLRCVDALGRERPGPLRLPDDAPYYLRFAVNWEPIIERGRESLEAGRPVRPSGRIVVRWPGGERTVRVEMVAHPAVRTPLAGR